MPNYIVITNDDIPINVDGWNNVDKLLEEGNIKLILTIEDNQAHSCRTTKYISYLCPYEEKQIGHYSWDHCRVREDSLTKSRYEPNNT